MKIVFGITFLNLLSTSMIEMTNYNMRILHILALSSFTFGNFGGVSRASMKSLFQSSREKYRDRCIVSSAAKETFSSLLLEL